MGRLYIYRCACLFCLCERGYVFFLFVYLLAGFCKSYSTSFCICLIKGDSWALVEVCTLVTTLLVLILFSGSLNTPAAHRKKHGCVYYGVLRCFDIVAYDTYFSGSDTGQIT